MKVVSVWAGCYVGDGAYEGGICSYKTIDGNYHDIEYEVGSTDFYSLIDGLTAEVRRLRRRKNVSQNSKESDLDLHLIDITEKWIFYFDDGTEIEFGDDDDEFDY